MGKANIKGQYLYAITMDSEGLGQDSIGIGKSSVYTIQEGRLGALVSDVPNRQIRPERRNLAAHRDVLCFAMEKTSALPLAFGIIANDRNAVRRSLINNKQALTSQLVHVAGKVEMGLKVALDVPNLFEYFISANEKLRTARDRLFGKHSTPSREDMIGLGQMFSGVLEEERERVADLVVNTLKTHCFDLKVNKCRKENELVNLACLIGRDEEENFENAVFDVARLFDNEFAFDYSGPWPLHSFSQVQMKL